MEYKKPLMSDTIVLPESDYRSDAELKNLITVPYSLLDASHPALTREQRKRVLKEKYEQKLIADGLETGILRLDNNGEIFVNSKQNLSVFKGFIFEALTVRLINDYFDTIGKECFLWCTERKQVKSNYLSKFKAFGRGFLSTKSNLPQVYNVTHKFDVQFYYINTERNEPEIETISNTKIEAGIQVKAITGNEDNEIIQPLLSNKYTHVLTYLRDKYNNHSYHKCINIIRNMKAKGQITHEKMMELENRVHCPEQLKITQNWIDEYDVFISDWWNGHVKGDDIIRDAVNNEISGYKYANSILIPL